MVHSRQAILTCLATATTVVAVLNVQAAAVTGKASKMRDFFFRETNSPAGDDVWEQYDDIFESGEMMCQENILKLAKVGFFTLHAMETANQTVRLHADRRPEKILAIKQEAAAAERGAEGAPPVILRAPGGAAREQVQAVVDETFELVGTIITSGMSPPWGLARILAGLFGMALVSLLVGTLTTPEARAIRRRTTNPQLLREMDLPRSLQAGAVDWVQRSTRAFFFPRHGRSREEPLPLRPLEGIIFPPDLEHRLRSLASSIRASCARGSPLPHVLLHGASGSGKSLVARQLVKACGFETVIIAGGDVGPLGAAASSELSGILRWIARAGRRERRGAGEALVTDDVEYALGDRRKIGMNEHARRALTAILVHSGEARPGFMMVLTSSRPQDIDEAMLDHIDEVIHLPTPRFAERKQLARQYFSTYLLYNVPEEDFIEAKNFAGSVNNEGASSSTAVVTSERQGRTLRNAPMSRTCERNRETSRVCKVGGGLGRLSEDFVPEAAGLVEKLAVKSEGFHCRDTARFFSAVQAAVCRSGDWMLTLDMWAAIERQKLSEFPERASLTTAPYTGDIYGATESTSNLQNPENDVPAPDFEFRSGRHMPCDPKGTPPKTIGLSFCGRKIPKRIPLPKEKPTTADEGRALRYARWSSYRVLLRAKARILLDKTRSKEKCAPEVRTSTADAYGATESTSTLGNLENDATAMAPDVVDADAPDPEIRGGRHDTPSDPEGVRPETILVGISFCGRKISRRIPMHKEKNNPRGKQRSSVRCATWTSKRMLLRAKARILLDKTRTSKKCAPEMGKSRISGLLRRFSRPQRS